MPVKGSTKSLLQISSLSISSLVLDSFYKRDASDVKKWAESLQQVLLAYVQSSIYEEIVQILLAKLDEDFQNNPETKVKIKNFVPSLFGAFNKSLDFTSFRVVADKTIMKTIYENFDKKSQNLEKLCLGREFFFVPDMIANLNSKLSQLPNLVSLKLFYVATDSMITDLGKICPKLRELNLDNSKMVGDSSALTISECKNLIVLKIQGTKISGKGCRTIIESCPNLEWIDHCPFNCDTDFQIFKSRKEIFDLILKGYREFQVLQASSEEIPEDNDQEQKPYTIKNFWLFNPKTEELQVSQLCPFLEKMKLDFVFEDLPFIPDGRPLESFRYLQTLELSFDKQKNHLLDNILSFCGDKLTSLSYSVCADYRSVVEGHNIIARRCPRLTTLKFIGDYYNAAHIDQETDSVLMDRNPDFQPHPHLEYLLLGGYCTDGRLAWLISGAPKIREISLDGNLENLSDSAWLAIMSENSLEKLESVWVNTSTNMTMQSIRHLLAMCPNIKRIGRLIHLREHTGGARRDNLLQLQQQARDENWDVDFVWVTPNRRLKTMSPSSG